MLLDDTESQCHIQPVSPDCVVLIYGGKGTEVEQYFDWFTLRILCSRENAYPSDDHLYLPCAAAACSLSQWSATCILMLSPGCTSQHSSACSRMHHLTCSPASVSHYRDNYLSYIVWFTLSSTHSYYLIYTEQKLKWNTTIFAPIFHRLKFTTSDFLYVLNRYILSNFGWKFVKIHVSEHLSC